MKTLFILLIFASPAYGWFFGPKDYDECILKHMKGAGSPEAAYVIRQSCENQFYDTSPVGKKAALEKKKKEEKEKDLRASIVYSRDCVPTQKSNLSTNGKRVNPFAGLFEDTSIKDQICKELEQQQRQQQGPTSTTNANSFSKGLITAAGEYIGVASSYDILLEQGCRPYVQIQKTKSSAVHEVMSRLRQIDPKISINDLYGGKHEEASADRMLREAVGKLVQTGSRGEGLSNSCKAAQWRLDRLYDEASSKWAAESSRVR